MNRAGEPFPASPPTANRSARCAAAPPRRQQRGFTLLEVMVAMTLFTLLVATAYTGLRVGARSVAATDARAGIAEELSMVTRIFETYLSSAQPVLRRQDTRDGRRRAVEFSGDGTEVTFLAEMPARIGYGGLYAITLRFAPGEEREDGTVLVFERRLFNADPQAELDGAAATERVLLTGLEGGSFAYFGAERRRERPSWRDEWKDMRTPPLAVRAEFDDSTRAWPVLTLPVRLQALRAVRGGNGEEEEEPLDELPGEVGEVGETGEIGGVGGGRTGRERSGRVEQAE